MIHGIPESEWRSLGLEQTALVEVISSLLRQTWGEVVWEDRGLAGERASRISLLNKIDDFVSTLSKLEILWGTLRLHMTFSNLEVGHSALTKRYL